ncbi:hypothetical protein GCM10022253_30810 [Sphingomonas endophytica]
MAADRSWRSRRRTRRLGQRRSLVGRGFDLRTAPSLRHRDAALRAVGLALGIADRPQRIAQMLLADTVPIAVRREPRIREERLYSDGAGTIALREGARDVEL